MSELLPCPFCGGSALRIDIDDQEELHCGGSFICCSICDASSAVYFGDKEPLVESWNRRAPIAPAAARDVLAERKRQIEEEDCPLEKDDRYIDGELVRAAECYLQVVADVYQRDAFLKNAPALWPWPVWFWKPKNDRRDLVRAGALILAEIERLDRKAAAND